ncbi:MAG: CRISPR-associated endonuclease Cas2 [Candidatus Fischerbacteria bacterium RBG_13_37_8]|uniref:CRISPR-associated endoribonuclease Cas2 n=1 Tax=Candidatus Fischerbacteria bacterium RBG_13_37_8 TaxID=1817863 RepID=A0A1F5VY69_9BACT|nr:MAG: CRISPR-associated endonuclease Cas2 [Candidatus Fischerbacteria bacterium RBG_13_37_8]
MNCIIIYDIVDDNLRNKIADACLDFGLQRVQYSAFFGELSHNQKETLFKRITRLIGDKEGNVQIYPICEKDLALKQVHIMKKKTDEK